ncbi:MAG: AAC(3) family N-acetyltransferase [Gemmatimonadales bacterium]
MPRASAARILPPSVKRRLKQILRACHRIWFGFTPADLSDALRRLGIAQGDVLMVHSGFDKFLGFHGGPVDVVRTLQAAVGTAGTLLMPTIPFQGTAIEYALGDPIFDARRTVSRMGLITEVFRRSPGVVRSSHPTHSVAAWGSRADALIAGHEQTETPCGRLTPYGRLLEYDGKILLMGVAPSTMTFCYFVAEELEPQLPIPVLTPETYALRWKDDGGTIRIARVRLFAHNLDHDLSPLIGEVKRRGQWPATRVGRLPLVLLRARDLYAAATALSERGLFVRPRPAS